MLLTEKAPPAEITCFRDLPERIDGVAPDFAPELRPGHFLDNRFVIDKPVSRSGMATIYLARDQLNDHAAVAVKVPHLQYEADPNFFSRFQREEEIGRKLNHPFLLKVIPVEGKSRPYIVTEYLRGCSLAHLLDAMRPLPEKDALKIASLLCEALQHMHKRSIVHRDLKPGNVMICRDRTIRLMDFGIASDTNSRRITLPAFSSTMGTPDYMAPEQVKNKRCDGRTDIYALGLILYEMLTGIIPFQNENVFASLNARVTGDPEAPRRINPALSSQAEEIVLHALQREPDDRYQTAAAFKADLDAPGGVQVTGYARRLKTPRLWRLSLREAPFLTGTLLGLAVISVQVLLFLFIRYFLPRR